MYLRVRVRRYRRRHEGIASGTQRTVSVHAIRGDLPQEGEYGVAVMLRHGRLERVGELARHHPLGHAIEHAHAAARVGWHVHHAHLLPGAHAPATFLDQLPERQLAAAEEQHTKPRHFAQTATGFLATLAHPVRQQVRRSARGLRVELAQFVKRQQHVGVQQRDRFERVVGCAPGTAVAGRAVHRSRKLQQRSLPRAAVEAKVQAAAFHTQ